jgi:hypothetical protein
MLCLERYWRVLMYLTPLRLVGHQAVNLRIRYLSRTVVFLMRLILPRLVTKLNINNLKMNFKYFKDDFINKWTDGLGITDERDRKIKAGVNWLFTIHKKSFERYEVMWRELREKCKTCARVNCKNEYNELMKHINVNKDNGGNVVVTGLKDNDLLTKYTQCKKGCYEKVDLLNHILGRRYRDWNKDLNYCFILCRAKPIDKTNDLPNCYITCMVDKSYDLAEIEFYIKYSYDKLVNEYDRGYFDNSKSDLTHIYRIKERPLTPDLVRKYL